MPHPDSPVETMVPIKEGRKGRATHYNQLDVNVILQVSRTMLLVLVGCVQVTEAHMTDSC